MRGKEGREEGRHRPRRENTARAAINQGKAHGARNPGRDGPALARSLARRGRADVRFLSSVVRMCLAAISSSFRRCAVSAGQFESSCNIPLTIC